MPAHPAGYLLAAAAALATFYAAPVSILGALIGGAVSSAAWLNAYLRLNPRWVGIELAILVAAAFLSGPPLPAAWMAACAMAGAVGALLTGGGAREDHHFFVPPLAALGFCAFLYTLGNPGSDTIVAWIVRTMDALTSEVAAALRLPENAPVFEEIGGETALAVAAPRIALIAVCILLFGWLVLHWALGQLVRRRAGRALPFGNTLLIFRIRAGYTFLLILALIFEILSVWFEQERLRLVSYPLFSVCAAGFWLVYLGIVLFLLALGRAIAPGASRWGFRLAAVVALGLSFHVGPLVGLADVWFDFRKMRRIRKPMP